ncbi:hypothetical protein CTI12_AA380460 [Artemisia annua]|uniref:Uncharacterized protein n=1 Tax=Artemisia annua TaxID=35608 RepID=A0A2U1MGY3_ARTAN|nr:hypothetical protein CTI12_AA380460 [Artemisia annua]
MAGNALPNIGCVKLTDLIPSEGLPSDAYKLSVATLYNHLLSILPPSSSSLHVMCHARPTFQGAQHHSLTTQEDGQLHMFSDHEDQVDKSLIFIIKSDKVSLHIRDLMVGGCLWMVILVLKKQWVLSLSENKTSEMDTQIMTALWAAKYSSSKLIAKYCKDSVDSQAKTEVLSQCYANTGSMKPLMKRKKNTSRLKPLPPSKRLRLEAQRVLKERFKIYTVHMLCRYSLACHFYGTQIQQVYGIEPKTTLLKCLQTEKPIIYLVKNGFEFDIIKENYSSPLV